MGRVLSGLLRVDVVTAKGGFFKGLSTVIVHTQSSTDWAKVLYLPSLNSKRRLEIHDEIISFLDAESESTQAPPANVLRKLEEYLLNGNVLEEFIMIPEEMIMATREDVIAGLRNHDESIQ